MAKRILVGELPDVSMVTEKQEKVLALNANVLTSVPVKPTARTNEDKAHYKRDRLNRGTGTALDKDFDDIKHTTLSERGALFEYDHAARTCGARR
jgi:dihydropyrimidine dehydrogenase (NADP+)